MKIHQQSALIAALAALLAFGSTSAQAGENDMPQKTSVSKPEKAATHARGTVQSVDVQKREITITIAAKPDAPVRTATIKLSDDVNLRKANADGDALVPCSLFDVETGQYLIASGDVDATASSLFNSNTVYVGKDGETVTKLLPVAEQGMEDAGFMPESKDSSTSSSTPLNDRAMPY